MSFVPYEFDTTRKKIIDRFMELFDTTEEIKQLFFSLLPETSILRKLIDIDSITDKKELCEILLEYVGENFLHTVGKIRTIDENDFVREQDGKYIIREKLLDQICKKHYDPKQKELEILKEFNTTHKNSNFNNFTEMVRYPWFFTKTWTPILTEKILEFPPSIADKPVTEQKGKETTELRKRSSLKRLYDYQTQAVIKINEMLSQKEKGKRILVNIPTGAGKTRLAVEAVVDWLNLRDQDRLPNAHQQQKEGRLFFWFASTNELCEQAADEFEYIYSQIGAAGLLNLTRLFGTGRHKLTDILGSKPGTHIVITNTEHFQEFLKTESNEEKTFRIDKYEDSVYFKFIREQTIGIIIDEAHEVNSESYQNFLAAMGFDFSGRKDSLNNINKNNIVLVGLTATAYKGSGFQKIWKCASCEKIVTTAEKNSHISFNPKHTTFISTEEEEDFLKSDKENDPDYFSKLDRGTKLIHKTFGGNPYVPIPQLGQKKSKPSAVIDAPLFGYENEHLKISGLNSFDSNSDITYFWEIKTFGEPTKLKDESEFYYKFNTSGTYTIKLRVTNSNGIFDEKFHEIHIEKTHISKKNRTGSLQDNKEFYEILEKREILCKITHGVINGPQLKFDPAEIKRWKLGKLSCENEETINNAIEYNERICEIVNKCIKTHNKKRILVFASSVRHSQELAIILGVKYRLMTKSIDGGTNPGLRRKIIREYREGNIDVLCNFGVLTTGFDVPEIDVVVICRDVGSNALYTQMIGRGQRGKVAGGTDELWLITSFFPKSQVEESTLKLGWEALAESWNQFSPEIKEDLNVEHYTTSSSDGLPGKTKETSETKTPQIIGRDPIKFKCITCQVEGEGYKNLMNFFRDGYHEEIINKKLNDGSFPTNCYNCRVLRKIAKYTKCGFCELFLKHHNYDPVFIIIANLANNSQIKKESLYFKDLQNELYNKFKKNIPNSYFNMNNPTIKKMIELGLLDIKDDLRIDFKQIIEFPTLKKLIESSYQTDERERNGEKLINENKNIEILDTTSDNFRDWYGGLKITHGHIPTKRQFQAAISDKDEWWKEFKEKFNENYDDLLDIFGEIIKDDHILKDALFDEYFEKCIEVRDKITRDQLNDHGKYRISDYEDIFGSFSLFERKLENNLERVLTNYEQKKKEKDSEFEAIGNDLKYIKNILHRWPHFEDIRVHSRIGIYRYIIQTKISNLKYLKKYDGEEIGSFLRVTHEFLRLLRILECIPTEQQFKTLTSPVVTLALHVSSHANYEEFLKVIDIANLPSVKITSEHIEKMQSKTINQLKMIESKNGSEQVIILIESAENQFDELSISINAWFEDKNALKEQFITTTQDISP